MSGFGMDGRGVSEYENEPVFNWYTKGELVSWNKSRTVKYAGEKEFLIAENIKDKYAFWVPTVMPPLDVYAIKHGFVYEADMAMRIVSTYRTEYGEHVYRVHRIEGIETLEQFNAFLEFTREYA
jgi:hypothetical protein